MGPTEGHCLCGRFHCPFSELELARIWATVFESNPASARVLEKAGYELEGRLRKSVYKNGVLMDGFLYAILRETV